ncbi:transposase [Xenorhabdus beddingii]|uniref:Transposase n=2 Tax=Xenorhabdus beddingii TaxID=40578 RepID=A0A1Y2SS07_9GAMM|nr:transposase [Xenorhabdus beddingii]
MIPKYFNHAVSHGEDFIAERFACFLFFKHKLLDRLIGSGVEAEHLNDNALGRTLDALYDAGGF